VFDRILLVAAVELIAVAVAHSGVVSSFGNSIARVSVQYTASCNEEYNNNLIEQVKLERQLNLEKNNVSIR
jgi:hypothetical protein